MSAPGADGVDGPAGPSAESWHELNSRHLAASLQSLRLLLVRLGASPAGPEPAGRSVPSMPTRPVGRTDPLPASTPPPPKKGGFWRRGRPAPPVPPTAPGPVPVATRARPAARGVRTEPSGTSIDQQIADAAGLVAELESGPIAPALVLLATRFGLSTFERDLSLLCVAMHLDTRMAELCASAQGDPSSRSPTFALALTLFDNPAWEALAPDRPLRFWRLVEVRGGPLQPLTTSPLLADERIVNYCKGLNTPDGRLSELFVPFVFSPLEASDLPPSQHPQLELIVRRVAAQEEGSGPVIHMIGPDRASKQVLARCVADRFGLPLVRVPLECLPGNLTELEELARLLRRESAPPPGGALPGRVRHPGRSRRGDDAQPQSRARSPRRCDVARHP